MKLVELLQAEQEGLRQENVLLLRHATAQIEMLERVGASIQEYTAIQPTGGKYDFFHPNRPPVEVVVAIVRDHVHAVYRVTGAVEIGIGTDICSPAYKQFELYRQKNKGELKAHQMCRKYWLNVIQSGADGAAVSGWKGKERTPVQRFDGQFFHSLDVLATPIPQSIRYSSSSDPEWAEGTPELRLHLVKERAPGLAAAKKRAFVEEWGRLFCERCLSDPVQAYGLAAAEMCIEVHHAATPVSKMKHGHSTKLDDLQCLCANCHRLIHAIEKG